MARKADIIWEVTLGSRWLEELDSFDLADDASQDEIEAAIRQYISEEWSSEYDDWDLYLQVDVVEDEDEENL